MEITELIGMINEGSGIPSGPKSPGSSGKGSKEGRSKGLSQKNQVNSVKSKVTVFHSVMDALKKGHFGQTFSTPKSNRLYVVTKHKWGKSDKQKVDNRVAKGFSSGDGPTSLADVKKYAQKTMQRHGGKSSVVERVDPHKKRKTVITPNKVFGKSRQDKDYYRVKQTPTYLNKISRSLLQVDHIPKDPHKGK